LQWVKDPGLEGGKKKNRRSFSYDGQRFIGLKSQSGALTFKEREHGREEGLPCLTKRSLWGTLREGDRYSAGGKVRTRAGGVGGHYLDNIP